jgi:hypothetical protein
MIPENIITIADGEEFSPPRDDPYLPIISRHIGGEFLSISTSDLQTHSWAAEYIDGEIIIYRDDSPNNKVAVIIANDVTSISLAFDSSMRPTIAYIQDGIGKLYYYNTATQAVETLEFTGVTSAQVVNDDPRPELTEFNDIIFAYTKNNNLYYRQQRDRYTIEYLAASDIGENNILKRLGPTSGLRLQFEIASSLPDLPSGCLDFPARAYNARVIRHDNSKFYLVWELENAAGAYITASNGSLSGVLKVQGMEYELPPYATGTKITFTITPTTLVQGATVIREDTTDFTF